MEDDSANVDAFQGLALSQNFLDVPGNGLSLAIRIGRQDQRIVAFEGFSDIIDAFFSLPVHLPRHIEIVIGTHRAVLRRQVTHVAIARKYVIIGTKILIDGLRLGRRFNYDNCHGGAAKSLCFCLSPNILMPLVAGLSLPSARYELTLLSPFVNSSDETRSRILHEERHLSLPAKAHGIHRQAMNSARYRQLQ